MYTYKWFDKIKLCFFLQLWSYEDGELLYVGDAHSAPVSRLEFSPTESFLISVSLDGAILKWALPLGIQS